MPASGGTVGTVRPLMLLLLLCLAPETFADWLVCHDGERVETRGPWKVERSLVVFKTANGSLSSLRLADIDLEASVRATVEAKAETPRLPASDETTTPAEPAAAKRLPVLVLTNKNVGRAEDPVELDPEEAMDDSDASPEAEPSPLEVISWRQAGNLEITGVEILGTLRNDSANIVTGAGVQVSLFDHEGQLIARRDAFLDAVSIAGRGTTGFRALFPGVDVFDGEPVFEVRARELVLEVGEDRGD